MKLFHRYVIKQFLKYILIVQLFVTLLSLFTSAMADSKMLAKYQYSFLQLLNVEIYSVLLSFNLAMPITTTVSAIIVILLMMRNHEVLAYITIGGTVRTLAVPFLTVGVLISTFMIFFEYKIIPKVRESREILLSEIRKEPYEKRYGYVNLWVVDDKNKLINIEVIDLLNQTFINTKEYILNNKFQVEKITSTPLIVKTEHGWNVGESKEIDISSNPPKVTDMPATDMPAKVVTSPLFNDLIKISDKDPRALSPEELLSLIEMMKNRALKATSYELLFYSKYANAISVLVLLVLTFPLAINFSRNYSLIKNAAMTFATGLVFWLVQAMCYSLGNTGTLSPFVANFFPALVFAFISAILIYKRGRAG